MRSNELRKQVKSMLDSLQLGPVYYYEADVEALYPHIVFNFEGIDHTDLNRNDYDLVIDVWGKKQEEVIDIADAIDDLLRTNNAPADVIYPTFYLSARSRIADNDISIRREMLRFDVQTYDKGE